MDKPHFNVKLIHENFIANVEWNELKRTLLWHGRLRVKMLWIVIIPYSILLDCCQGPRVRDSRDFNVRILTTNVFWDHIMIFKSFLQTHSAPLVGCTSWEELFLINNLILKKWGGGLRSTSQDVLKSEFGVSISFMVIYELMDNLLTGQRFSQWNHDVHEIYWLFVLEWCFSPKRCCWE